MLQLRPGASEEISEKLFFFFKSCLIFRENCSLQRETKFQSFTSLLLITKFIYLIKFNLILISADNIHNSFLKVPFWQTFYHFSFITFLIRINSALTFPPRKQTGLGQNSSPFLPQQKYLQSLYLLLPTICSLLALPTEMFPLLFQ